jgi:uncharacterized protein YceK
MASRALRVALLLSGLPIAGCGTVANLTSPGPEGGGKAPFGGVRHDMAHVREAASGGPASEARPESDQHPKVFSLLLWAADLPFTLIGDVVTWPYVRAYSFINQPTLSSPAIQVAEPALPVTPAAAEEGRPPLLPATR